MSEEAQSVDDSIGWAAFHANAQQPRDFDVTITSLLPLFPDDSKSVAMICHSMDVVQRAVHLLNPGQVPVLTLDQPLFTIAKQIQWNWPDVYGAEKCVILLGCHAFTGCDTVSSFAGRGKKTAFDIWKSFNEVTAVFSTLSTNPSRFNDDFMCILEIYVVLLYDRTCTETTVDSARKHIFCSKARSIEAMPPTGAALLQHTKLAVYQGGHVWGQAHIRTPELPSPEACGWRKSSTQR